MVGLPIPAESHTSKPQVCVRVYSLPKQNIQYKGSNTRFRNMETCKSTMSPQRLKNKKERNTPSRTSQKLLSSASSTVSAAQLLALFSVPQSFVAMGVPSCATASVKSPSTGRQPCGSWEWKSSFQLVGNGTTRLGLGDQPEGSTIHNQKIYAHVKLNVEQPKDLTRGASSISRSYSSVWTSQSDPAMLKDWPGIARDYDFCKIGP